MIIEYIGAIPADDFCLEDMGTLVKVATLPEPFAGLMVIDEGLRDQVDYYQVAEGVYLMVMLMSGHMVAVVYTTHWLDEDRLLIDIDHLISVNVLDWCMPPQLKYGAYRLRHDPTAMIWFMQAEHNGKQVDELSMHAPTLELMAKMYIALNLGQFGPASDSEALLIEVAVCDQSMADPQQLSGTYQA